MDVKGVVGAVAVDRGDRRLDAGEQAKPLPAPCGSFSTRERPSRALAGSLF
jgi:hypothetical protein